MIRSDRPARLHRLADRELLSRIQFLVRRERAVTISILDHLNEITRRRLFLDLGYSSLFDYCVRGLEYSPSAAGRRIQSARCIHRYPEMLELLRTRELSLGVVALIAPILTDENRESIVARVRGRSYREVERIVCEYRPPGAFRDRVRPVRVVVREVKATAEAASVRNPAEGAALDVKSTNAPASVSASESRTDNRTTLEHDTAPPSFQAITPSAGSASATETKLLLQFLVSEACMKKFEEAKALLSHRCPGGSLGDVLEAVLSDYVNRHSPVARKQRRESRQRAVSPNAPADHSQRWECAAPGTRHIANDIRDAVFARDRGRCTYVARDGTRCGATHLLQIDHVQPRAAGGSNGLSNLRLLCAAHNRRAAERTLGAHTMTPFWPRE